SAAIAAPCVLALALGHPAPAARGRPVRGSSRSTPYPLAVAEVEDTQTLWRRFRAKPDDKGLRDRLILTYAPLVKYVAGRLGSGLPAHVDDDDLISYGLLGLIGAIERYDPDRDVKFETYAI